MIPDLGRKSLAKLGPQDLAALYRRRLDDGLSPRSVQRTHAVLHRALKQAERWGLIDRNPAALVDAPRPVRPKFQPLVPPEIRELLKAARGERFEALFVVAVTTELRQGSNP